MEKETAGIVFHQSLEQLYMHIASWQKPLILQQFFQKELSLSNYNTCGPNKDLFNVLPITYSQVLMTK